MAKPVKGTLIGILSCLIILALPAGNALAEQLKMRPLIQGGWEILEKSQETKTEEGVPPYQNATRVISVNRYLLGKDDQRVRCSIAYDFQQDQFTETCMRENIGTHN